MGKSRTGWGVALVIHASLVAYYSLQLVILFVTQQLRIGTSDSGTIVSLGGMAIMLSAELLFTYGFEWRFRPRSIHPSRNRRLLSIGAMLLRMAYLGFAVWIIVEFPARLSPFQDPGPLKTSEMLLSWTYMGVALSANLWLTVAVVTIWGLLVEFFTVRLRLLRGLLVAAMGPVLLVGLLLANYFAWLPGPDVEELERQPGVEVVFDAQRCENPQEKTAWNFSRAMRTDGRRFHITFGKTVGSDDKDQVSLWKIDIDDGSYQTLRTSQIRDFATSHDGKLLHVVPFYKGEVLSVDADTLEVRSRARMPDMELRHLLQPVQIVRRRDSLIMPQLANPTLHRFSIENNAFEDKISLVDADIALPNDLCCGLIPARQPERFFAIGGSPLNAFLVELSAEPFEVVASIKLPESSNSFVLAGGERPTIFFMGELSGNLFRVDLETQDITLVRSWPYMTRIAYDPYGDQLLLTNRMYGTLTIARPDGTEIASYEVGAKANAVQATKDAIFIASHVGIVRIAR